MTALIHTEEWKAEKSKFCEWNKGKHEDPGETHDDPRGKHPVPAIGKYSVANMPMLQNGTERPGFTITGTNK